MSAPTRVVVWVLCIAGLMGAPQALAHAFAPSLLRLIEGPEQRFTVVWKTPVVQDEVPLVPTLPDGCAPMSAGPLRSQGTASIQTWHLTCPDGVVAQTVGIDGLEITRGTAMVIVEWLDGRSTQRVLNEGATSFEIPAASTSFDVAVDYVGLGVEHIWAGMDHLLFVFGLLLLVGVGARLLHTTIAFTVGHSITLSMVTLGRVDYPVAWVEFAIACSIFVLAVELARDRERSVLWRHPWWLAAGFGLLHGMGFAGALAETGLPQGHVPLALLFFNVGIETGQVAFLVALMAVWHAVRARLTPWRDRLRLVPVYALGVLSAMWCIERGLDALGI